jgi:hypothetical protein
MMAAGESAKDLVLRELTAYREPLKNGWVADVREAVRLRPWFGELETSPEMLAKTSAQLDLILGALDRAPRPDVGEALRHMEGLRLLWDPRPTSS